MKHCKNCNTRIPDDSETCPNCNTELHPAKDSPKGLYISYKIAALVLIINSILLLIEAVVMKTEDNIGNSGSSIVMSIVIGMMILANKAKALFWARFSIVAGAILFTGMNLFQQNYFGAGLQLFFSISLIGLLFGKPNKVVIGICSTLILLYIALEVVGLQAEFTGRNILSKVIATTNKTLEDIESEIVLGTNNVYSLQINSSGWKKMSPEEVNKNNPSADIWLVKPEYDAHVIVIAEVVADSLTFDLETMTDVVIQNVQNVVQNLSVKSRDSLTLSSGLVGNLITTTGTIESFNAKYRYGIFAIQNFGFQIICFSSEKVFKHVEKEFDAIIRSFSPDREAMFPAKEQVES